jgi:hypothetical protein
MTDTITTETNEHSQIGGFDGPGSAEAEKPEAPASPREPYPRAGAGATAIGLCVVRRQQSPCGSAAQAPGGSGVLAASWPEAGRHLPLGRDA